MTKIVTNIETGETVEVELNEDDLAGLLTDGELEKINKEINNRNILAKIQYIENEKQPRAIRESYSADEAVREQAMIYIKQYDDEIIKLRGQLL